MSMLLIRGSFRPSGGAKPDGDTVPFIPDTVADWKLVPGTPIRPGVDGQAAVRLEAVDALETHYARPGTTVQHQPLGLAHQAADELLTWLGFTDIHRAENETVTTTPETVPGFILTRGADVYGRCVALVGRGRPPACSGYEIDVDEGLLKKTANHHLLTVGLAYPTFYAGFPSRLRAVMTAAAKEARDASPKKGVWLKDATTEGAKITGMPSLTADDGAVILPKLFRRLKDYFDLNPANPPLDCFPAFLAGAGDRFRVTGRPKEITGLQHVVEITNEATLRMTERPEDLLFVEK
ncbi:nuclease [Streptomyces millisiae]|uniref:Nuclease n=1 Tax=Streptomyces millisiae TaxID=3075542 RepID=A0ABU2LIR0_9ACTN|nr:nuclease [Streptomyces sp. DSM 44918]MDT0317157.1 nuclease [Streptomyces sp. DSM 44918]